MYLKLPISYQKSSKLNGAAKTKQGSRSLAFSQLENARWAPQRS